METWWKATEMLGLTPKTYSHFRHRLDVGLEKTDGYRERGISQSECRGTGSGLPGYVMLCPEPPVLLQMKRMVKWGGVCRVLSPPSGKEQILAL